MARFSDSARRQLVLQGVAGVVLILVGATALLWLVFDDRLPSTALTPSPAGISVWAIVHVTAAAALAGGTWLLALTQVNRRRRRGR